MEAVKDIAEAEQDIIDEFEMFDDWADKYEHLISEGKSLPLIDKKYKNEDHIVKGCQSQVWLHADYENGIVHYTTDSDAIITKGLVSMVIGVLSNHSPEEIVNSELYFIDKIGLHEHLSPTRSNGLLSMIKQMKMDAFALQSQVSNN